MPSTRCAVTLVALLVLTGCSGLPSPNGTEASPGTPAPSPAPTITSPESTETTIPAAAVVDYRDLPNGTQQLVRIALENGSVRGDSDEFDGLSQADDRYDEYLRYDGTTYAIEWENSMRAEYSLWSVEPTNDTAAVQDGGVVAYENRSASGQRLFDRVGIGGNYSDMYEREAFPEELRPNASVAYEGQFYRTVVIHADIPVWELRLQPVDRSRTVG